MGFAGADRGDRAFQPQKQKQSSSWARSLVPVGWIDGGWVWTTGRQKMAAQMPPYLSPRAREGVDVWGPGFGRRRNSTNESPTSVPVDCRMVKKRV